MLKALPIVLVAALSGVVVLAQESFDEYYRQAVEDVEQHKFREAADAFESARRLNPRAPGIQKQIGLALFQAKEFRGAVPSLEAARAEQPDDMQVLLALGTSLARLQQLPQAQAVFADLLERHPNSAQLHLLWGQAYA